MKKPWIWLGLALLPVLGGAAYFWRQLRNEARFGTQIQTAAQRYGVDPMLIKAIIWRESRFHPEARGSKGELGLMQVQEIAAHEWADAERINSFTHVLCLDPGTNTLAGTFYLGKLLKRYALTDDPVPYALADYNAGRSHVLRWNTAGAATNSALFLDHVGFPSTKKYIKAVIRRQALYRFLARWGCN